MLDGVIDPAACHKICSLIDKCTHWTVDLDDQGCYVVDHPGSLEYSSDKISGPKECKLKEDVDGDENTSIGDDNNSWSSWTACSESCNGGVKTRTRTLNAKVDEQTMPCNTENCQIETSLLPTCRCGNDQWSCDSSSCGPRSKCQKVSLTDESYKCFPASIGRVDHKNADIISLSVP